MCDEGWQRLLQDASKFGANFHVSRDPEKIKSATAFASRTMQNAMRAFPEALGASKESASLTRSICPKHSQNAATGILERAILGEDCSVEALDARCWRPVSVSFMNFIAWSHENMFCRSFGP